MTQDTNQLIQCADISEVSDLRSQLCREYRQRSLVFDTERWSRLPKRLARLAIETMLVWESNSAESDWVAFTELQKSDIEQMRRAGAWPWDSSV